MDKILNYYQLFKLNKNSFNYTLLIIFHCSLTQSKFKGTWWLVFGKCNCSRFEVSEQKLQKYQFSRERSIRLEWFKKYLPRIDSVKKLMDFEEGRSSILKIFKTISKYSEKNYILFKADSYAWNISFQFSSVFKRTKHSIKMIK